MCVFLFLCVFVCEGIQVSCRSLLDREPLPIPLRISGGLALVDSGQLAFPSPIIIVHWSFLDQPSILDPPGGGCPTAGDKRGERRRASRRVAVAEFESGSTGRHQHRRGLAGREPGGKRRKS